MNACHNSLLQMFQPSSDSYLCEHVQLQDKSSRAVISSSPRDRIIRTRRLSKRHRKPRLPSAGLVQSGAKWIRDPNCFLNLTTPRGDSERISRRCDFSFHWKGTSRKWKDTFTRDKNTTERSPGILRLLSFSCGSMKLTHATGIARDSRDTKKIRDLRTPSIFSGESSRWVGSRLKGRGRRRADFEGIPRRVSRIEGRPTASRNLITISRRGVEAG